jgi:hypothetical protein
MMMMMMMMTTIFHGAQPEKLRLTEKYNTKVEQQNGKLVSATNPPSYHFHEPC